MLLPSLKSYIGFPHDRRKALNSLMWPTDPHRITFWVLSCPSHTMPSLAQPQSLCLGCAPYLILRKLASFCHLDLGSKVTSSEIPLLTDSTMPLPHILFIAFINLCKCFLYLLVINNAKECSNYRTIALISHASKVMLKILQARLQQYVNRELPDVQAGFRKRRGTRDQIANICWILEKAREFQKNIYFCFID